MSWPEQIFNWLGYGRYYASPSAVADGATAPLLIDPYGRLQFAAAAAAPAGVTAVRQLTAASVGTLKAGAGSLVEVTLWNSGASALWFQVHNKASDPVNADACVDQVLVPAGAAIGWRPAVPVACGTQVRWAASTTPGTLTLPGAPAMGFSAGVL